MSDRVKLLANVGALLGAAHARGVVHGGIKASNLLVCGHAATPAVTLTDFSACEPGTRRRTTSRW